MYPSPVNGHFSRWSWVDWCQNVSILGDNSLVSSDNCPKRVGIGLGLELGLRSALGLGLELVRVRTRVRTGVRASDRVTVRFSVKFRNLHNYMWDK